MLEPEDEMSIGINTLPDELILLIFKLLPLEAVLSCEKVCQRWSKLATDPSVWRQIVIVHSGKPGRVAKGYRSLEIIGSHYKYIRHLKVQYEYTYPIIKSILARCDNIISLELIMCRLGKDFQDDIKKWKTLKKLNLKNSIIAQPGDDITIQYDRFKDLNYLALSDFGLNVMNRDSLLGCTNLTHIYIEKIKYLSLQYITHLIIVKIDILVAFHFYGGRGVSDNCLNILSKGPFLKDLAIIRCENVNDDGLLTLRRLKCINHLQLWNNSSFSEKSLLETLGSPSLVGLKSLSLSRIRNVSPVIVDLISEHYKNLKFLAVYQCPKIINTDYEKQLKSKFRNIDVVLY